MSERKYIQKVDIAEGKIEINLFGQIFKEYVFNEIGYPPKEWMIGFGQKLQYVGKMIERQAKLGVSAKIQNGGTEIISIGFNEAGRLIK